MKQLTLEMSLKPFKSTDEKYIKSVCEKIFSQWKPLIGCFEKTAILLWTSDGSEILDYRGRLEDEFEWCYHIGIANPKCKWDKVHDPEGKGLHIRSYKYMENPPQMTYAILKTIIRLLKETGKEILGDIPIEVGETFDPGPEFAISDFKYNRHNEICVSNEMGEKGMIYAGAKLNGDSVYYAGYPDGIPEGLPFASFFGRQCECFFRDMEFDFLWLSNGVGFGRDTWNCCGSVFDGKDFHMEQLETIRTETLDFWKLFRRECPLIPIHTRGTNMSMGIDLATDGVPLSDIYDGNFNMLPPPNSPWAAIDGDFGLELMGYMSRIAKLPDKRYMMRYYLHDPWWVNSPWYDRYGSLPYDIYLPFSVCRIDENGVVNNPTHFNILSIDNSMGNMPDDCVYEPLPHIRKAIKEAPDKAPVAVWVYPFEQYSSAQDKQAVQAMYFEDWYIRGAINQGMPISAVTSANAFVKQNKDIYKASVLITPTPKVGNSYEEELLEYGKNGGKILFYGNAANASEQFRALFGLTEAEPICGELPVQIDGKNVGILKHTSVLSGGGLSEVGEGFAYAGNRVIGVQRGNMVWLRGTVCCDCIKGESLLKPHNEEIYFAAETLQREALAKVGFEILLEKPYKKAKSPVMTISRYNEAYLFSVYNKSTAVQARLKFPQGAPILFNYEAELQDGYAVYEFPKSEHSECRVFVVQESGLVEVTEFSPVSNKFRRRIVINGLQNATVRILGEHYCKKDLTVVCNSGGDFFVGEPFDGGYTEINGETYFEARNITGKLLVSMPIKKQ